jgi:NADPH2:quinone reductase
MRCDAMAVAAASGLSMRAWRVHALGEPGDVLAMDDVEDPVPGPDEVLLDVDAAALNFPDLLLCRGQYQERPALPFTLGLEVAGRIAKCGEHVDFEVGRRVLALPTLPNGGLAERVVVAAADVFPVPDSMPAVAAAALPVAYQTGYCALHRRGSLRSGETLLVHGGAGGVGSAAIQLGSAAGARVIATAASTERLKVCADMGAELTINYLEEDFVDRVKQFTDGRGADVIYDPVGGDVFDKSRRCVAFEGRILVIGFAGGRIADAPTNHALVKNYSIVGVHWGLYRKMRPDLVTQMHQEILGLYDQGRISPLIGAQLEFTDLLTGLQMIDTRQVVGKVVISVSETPADAA